MYTKIFTRSGLPDEVFLQAFVVDEISMNACFDLIFKKDGRVIMFIPSYEPEIRLQLEIELEDLNFYDNYFTEGDRILWEAVLMMHNHLAQFSKSLRDETIKTLLESFSKKKFIEFAKVGLSKPHEIY